MKYFFENIRNNIDFFIRNNFVFSRINYSEESEDKSEIKSFLENKYDLSLLEKVTKQNYKDNLYFLECFEKYIGKNKKDEISILDIGSKNWYYAKSEFIFFESFSSKFILNGIELDGNRLYSTFYSRKEVAKYHIKNLNNTKYIVGDFLKHNEKYDYIIWILPFITKYPHVKWGLPLKHFKPLEMLKHSYNLLKEGGEILIINQGIDEYNIQKEMNERLNLEAIYFGEIQDNYGIYKNKRYCSKIIKK